MDSIAEPDSQGKDMKWKSGEWKMDIVVQILITKHKIASKELLKNLAESGAQSDCRTMKA